MKRNIQKVDLKDISNNELLEIYESFIEYNHYEATNEYDYIRLYDFDYNDVKSEVNYRLGVYTRKSIF